MASLTFQNFIFFLGSGRPQTRFSSNVVFVFLWMDIILLFIGQNMIIMSFAIRNKAALRTFSNANLSGN